MIKYESVYVNNYIYFIFFRLKLLLGLAPLQSGVLPLLWWAIRWVFDVEHSPLENGPVFFWSSSGAGSGRTQADSRCQVVIYWCKVWS